MYINNIFSSVPHLRKLLITALIACCSAIIFNDSGIVTAALMMHYVLFGVVLVSQLKS
jgi:hypothetical protein